MAQEVTEGGAAVATAERSLLDQIIYDGKVARDQSQREYARDLVGEFVNDVLADEAKVGSDVVAMINARIAEIDTLLSDQLNEILHSTEFQELEATWRGLRHLVFKAETGTKLKLRLLNVSKADLLKDLEKAVEFDQSALFKKVYEEEYGTFGGHPYSMLVGGYEFGRHPQDIALLKLISEVASAAHAPFIAAASPRLFDMDSHVEMPIPRDLSKVFESAELAPWRSFRESEESRYVALVLPRVLMRLPYGPATKPVEGMDFREDVTGVDHSKYLWGNAAYVMAERVAASFSQHGWTAAIRGVEGGGKVEGLPIHTFYTVDGDVAMKSPTEIGITDRRENELNELGFITLVHKKNEDFAAFFGGQTVNKPRLYSSSAANANARLSAMLPYMLNASRFAHYVKVMMRDKIGSFMSEDSIRDYLNTWISEYVLGKDDAGQSLKAKYPLREARVDVKPVPGRPGSYQAVIFVRPHFQLEDLSTSIRLVAELPAAAA